MKNSGKIAAIIEVRMASTRLPGKTLRPILGKPMFELLLERLAQAKTLNDIVVATTENPADQAIEDLAKRLNLKFYRGSENDVLDRVLKTALKHQVDVIVEITGDNPLLDPTAIDRVVSYYLENNFDYVSNDLKKKTYPRGLEVRMFSTKVLEEVSRLTQDPADREHVSLYIYEHPEKYKLGHVSAPTEITQPDIRLTVDTLDDFKLVESIYNELYPRNPKFATKDVLDLIQKNPQLKQVNAHIQQKATR